MKTCNKQAHIENLQSNIKSVAASLPEVGQVILDLDLTVGGVWSVGFVVQPMALSLRARHGDLVQSCETYFECPVVYDAMFTIDTWQHFLSAGLIGVNVFRGCKVLKLDLAAVLGTFPV